MSADYFFSDPRLSAQSASSVGHSSLMLLFDTHCHLNFQTYKKDVDEVIRRALEAGIHMIIPATDLTSSQRALELATKYETGVYAAVGLHPVHLQDQEFEEEGRKVRMKKETFDIETYRRLAENTKVVAIGECGLDYYHLPQGDTDALIQKQQLTLLQQLQLAYDVDKPLIIHCRPSRSTDKTGDAYHDLVSLLKKFYDRKHRRTDGRGVIHCFLGDWELAWKYFDLGFIISFTGLITFNQTWDELIRKCPLDKFMVETDSPFLAPPPHRGTRNEPAYVIEVAKRIAEIKGVTVEKVVEATTENVRRLFGI